MAEENGEGRHSCIFLPSQWDLNQGCTLSPPVLICFLTSVRACKRACKRAGMQEGRLCMCPSSLVNRGNLEKVSQTHTLI